MWQRVEQLLRHLDAPRKHHLPDDLALEQFPVLYRQLCQHYAIARQRHYSPHLVDQLHRLVIRSHNYFYGVKSGWWRKTIELFAYRFPAVLRDNAGLFWLAAALFYLPGILLGLMTLFDDQIIYSIMAESQVSSMEAMYDPANQHVGRESGRESDTDFQMFGFYIFNNISIGFRTFASGLLLGIGSVLVLVYNGIVIGGVAGHLTRLGFTDTFWPFVSGHSSLELTAIIICGTAGLMLARAVFQPGPYSRIHALVLTGRDAIVLVSGAAIMLLLAAFVEAFWSSSPSLGNGIKYFAAALLWLLVIWFLAFSNRR